MLERPQEVAAVEWEYLCIVQVLVVPVSWLSVIKSHQLQHKKQLVVLLVFIMIKRFMPLQPLALSLHQVHLMKL
tara:strand:- start:788 stop:1009 length:222 start_codon:yes stop_codon:yes gene_type:complete